MNSDGTLARVTYLPGVTPPAERRDSDTERSRTPEPGNDAPQNEEAANEEAANDEAANDEAADEAGSAASGDGGSEASDEAQAQRAENVSMRALTRRGMSRWELGELLLSRELAAHIVEAELDRLEGVGLIDDAQLADTIVRTQHERKGLGRGALVDQLRRRRIDQSAIDLAMTQLSSSDEVARAGELAERRARQLQGLDHDTAVRRLSGYLQRKGYSADTVRAAVVEALPRRSSVVRFR